tara:strand:+ start:1651 stop:1884 length:234 start_codon:yes stop_codon:yes gene_type:complete
MTKNKQAMLKFVTRVIENGNIESMSLIDVGTFKDLPGSDTSVTSTGQRTLSLTFDCENIMIRDLDEAFKVIFTEKYQ